MRRVNASADARAPRASLEATARRLEELVDALVARDGGVSLKDALGGGAVVDGESTDLAAAVTAVFTAGSVADVLEARRSQVLHALQRLQAGLYGVCEDCGRRIAEERLEHQPAATRCVHCQARWEREGGTGVTSGGDRSE